MFTPRQSTVEFDTAFRPSGQTVRELDAGKMGSILLPTVRCLTLSDGVVEFGSRKEEDRNVRIYNFVETVCKDSPQITRILYDMANVTCPFPSAIQRAEIKSGRITFSEDSKLEFLRVRKDGLAIAKQLNHLTRLAVEGNPYKLSYVPRQLPALHTLSLSGIRLVYVLQFMDKAPALQRFVYTTPDGDLFPSIAETLMRFLLDSPSPTTPMLEYVKFIVPKTEKEQRKDPWLYTRMFQTAQESDPPLELASNVHGPIRVVVQYKSCLVVNTVHTHPIVDDELLMDLE